VFVYFYLLGVRVCIVRGEFCANDMLLCVLAGCFGSLGMKHCCLVMLTRCHAKGRSCVGGDAAGANLVLAQCVGGDVVGCCFCVCAVAALAKHWRAWFLWPSLVRVTLIRDVNCDSLKTWAIVVEPWCRAFCVLLCFGSLFIRFQVPCRCLYVFHGGRGLPYGFPGELLLGN